MRLFRIFLDVVPWRAMIIKFLVEEILIQNTCVSVSYWNIARRNKFLKQDPSFLTMQTSIDQSREREREESVFFRCMVPLDNLDTIGNWSS